MICAIANMPLPSRMPRARDRPRSRSALSRGTDPRRPDRRRGQPRRFGPDSTRRGCRARRPRIFSGWARSRPGTMRSSVRRQPVPRCCRCGSARCFVHETSLAGHAGAMPIDRRKVSGTTRQSAGVGSQALSGQTSAGTDTGTPWPTAAALSRADRSDSRREYAICEPATGRKHESVPFRNIGHGLLDPEKGPTGQSPRTACQRVSDDSKRGTVFGEQSRALLPHSQSAERPDRPHGRNGLQCGFPAALFGASKLVGDRPEGLSGCPEQGPGVGGERSLASVPFLSHPGIVMSYQFSVVSGLVD